MGVLITEDFEVPAGQVQTRLLGNVFGFATALFIGDSGVTANEPDVRIRGEVRLNPGAAAAGSLMQFTSSYFWDQGTVENHGLISAVGPSMAWVRTLYAPTWSPDIFNFGTIRAEARFEAVAYLGADYTVTITNAANAVISAEGNERARALYMTNGGDVINDGELLAHVRGGTTFPDSETATAILIGFGNFSSFSIRNTGLIQATGTSARQVIHGVSISADGAFEIINSGTIRGTHSIFQSVLYSQPMGGGTIHNSGLLDGHVMLARGDDTVINTGEIAGNIALGDGNNIFDSRSGRFAGSVTSGSGVDWLAPGSADNAISAGANVDTVVVSGLRSAYTVTQTATGVFSLLGTDGSDTLAGVEFVQFDDQVLRLRPGTGVSINFNTANTAAYQSAMNAIRDFDGNALGGNGSWLRIGQADVNGDGDIDQILVNRAIGRFATVGTDENGLVYFADHSWAGETRVAGIYIDPGILTGSVLIGSEFDSQRRFQNDLAIENINRVLGANDYDRDGTQEVYFALTDGTAFLRALMHADGNIRYANYQSQQEVIDYLTANGFGPETYAGWFSAPNSAAMQDSVDVAEANSLGRAPLGGEDAAMPDSINPASLIFSVPTLDDRLTAEFFG